MRVTAFILSFSRDWDGLMRRHCKNQSTTLTLSQAAKGSGVLLWGIYT